MCGKKHDAPICMQEAVGGDGADQSTWYGVTCWKVWAQGVGSGFAGIMRYGDGAMPQYSSGTAA